MKHTKLGFTGTRTSMTDAQKEVVAQFLGYISPLEVHHGECVGADAQFHEIVKSTLPQAHIIGHPPIKESYHAKLDGFYAQEKPGSYYDRDRAVVDACTIIIGAPGNALVGIKGEAPKSSDSWQMGGTGYTLRYAIGKGKEVLIVFPDGSHKRIESRPVQEKLV